MRSLFRMFLSLLFRSRKEKQNLDLKRPKSFLCVIHIICYALRIKSNVTLFKFLFFSLQNQNYWSCQCFLIFFESSQKSVEDSQNSLNIFYNTDFGSMTL